MSGHVMVYDAIDFMIPAIVSNPNVAHGKGIKGWDKSHAFRLRRSLCDLGASRCRGMLQGL